ncbi:conserved hypothetical protein [Crenothrix polyspora]|uniref:Uncharacterized protein n=1 Tax=Crenothrix polyspora TaxID=360316 RepID=A0A1R4GYF3_9GAMM|nr:hypothetical protein [Crenothrix polyspora]SJM88962.1 conserved hypothetical protein [Crenothrix polyspora]
MTDDELKALVASLVVAQKITDKKIADLFIAQKATDEQINRNSNMLTEDLNRMGITLGSIEQDESDIAKEFFSQCLLKDNHLGSIHFDDMAKNMEKHRCQIQEEYHLVMSNADAIGIVEVRYKAHINDLDKLDRKMKHFKQLFPIYQNFKQYGAIASFHINDDAKEEALKRGYFVLQRSGDVVHTESSEHLRVL